MLTPYDTGEVAEPKVWPTPTQAMLEASSEATVALKFERFGKVDFENDEGATVCTVQVVRSHLGYALWVEYGDDEETSVLLEAN